MPPPQSLPLPRRTTVPCQELEGPTVSPQIASPSAWVCKAGPADGERNLKGIQRIWMDGGNRWAGPMLVTTLKFT